jgi:hypothetical protein
LISKEYYHIPRELLDRLDKEVGEHTQEGLETNDLFIYEAITDLLHKMKMLRIEKQSIKNNELKRMETLTDV